MFVFGVYRLNWNFQRFNYLIEGLIAREINIYKSILMSIETIEVIKV